MNLSKWLEFRRMNPPMERGDALKLGLTNLAAVTNSCLGALEHWVYGSRIAAHRPQSPVFIVGHWRSGTTLLHEILSTDPQFTAPNLYHIIGFHHFLLTEKLMTRLTARLLPKSRPMDSMAVSWQAPQEDESILCILTLLSPYLMLAFHENIGVYDRFFELDSLSERELREWQEGLLLIMKKITLKNNKRPLLKSPTHSYRIPALLKMFPDAKFINIVRNPYAVFPSVVNLRKQTFLENGFPKFECATFEDDLFHLYERLFRRMERDVPLIPRGQYFEVKYEDYVKDIRGQTQRIYEHLQLDGWERVQPLVEAQVAERKAYETNKFSMEESLRRQIYERLKFVFDKYGYARE